MIGHWSWVSWEVDWRPTPPLITHVSTRTHTATLHCNCTVFFLLLTIFLRHPTDRQTNKQCRHAVKWIRGWQNNYSFYICPHCLLVCLSVGCLKKMWMNCINFGFWTRSSRLDFQNEWYPSRMLNFFQVAWNTKLRLCWHMHANPRVMMPLACTSIVVGMMPM